MIIMTCRELLIAGNIDNWYEVSTSFGLFKVYFRMRTKTDATLKLQEFSIAEIADRDQRVKVIEDMLKYATENSVEKVSFSNNKFTMTVIIDILETTV